MVKKADLIFVPLPVAGHLPATIELANALINHGIETVTLLLWKLPVSPYAASYATSLAASQPRIRLVNLPDIENPPPEELYFRSSEAYIYEYTQKIKPVVKDTVKGIISSSCKGLVIDFFCVEMVDVGNELNLASYIFLPCNTRFLGMMKYLPERHKMIASEFDKNSGDEELSVPGCVNPVPTKVMPSGLFKRESYEAYVKIVERLRDAKGILINTFSELEPRALDYFSRVQNFPFVYPVGPVLNLKDHPHPNLNPDQREEIMKWLDGQPDSSVVYLCFGSKGILGAPQIKEIANGLELSGYRFLWSIRTNPMENMDPNDLLPEGFLGRVAGRGTVCGWAPQVEVLAHKAIGGFVSHCGWNSILESVWYGIPIITWPMYAEQQLNAFTMVKELGLAVEMRLDYVKADGEIVMADEIVRAVRTLMEEGDSVVRKKVKEMADAAKRALMDGGSSSATIGRFIRNVLGDEC